MATWQLQNMQLKLPIHNKSRIIKHPPNNLHSYSNKPLLILWWLFAQYVLIRNLHIRYKRSIRHHVLSSSCWAVSGISYTMCVASSSDVTSVPWCLFTISLSREHKSSLTSSCMYIYNNHTNWLKASHLTLASAWLYDFIYIPKAPEFD